MMMRRLLLSLVLLLPNIAHAQPKLTVVDGEDKPLRHFEVMLHTADEGYELWKPSAEGTFSLSALSGYDSAASIDVCVRATGYASVLRQFSGRAKEEFAQNGATIVMEPGQKVRLKLKPPAGKQFPDDFSPDVYWTEFAERIEALWQPQNQHVPATKFDLLSVRPVTNKSAEFLLRLRPKQQSFYVSINHPGWLQHFKAGPFTLEDVTNGELNIEVPQPATIKVNLRWAKAVANDLPFQAVNYSLMKRIRRGDNSYYSVAEAKQSLLDKSFEISDLAPGNYLLTLGTEPKQPDRDQLATPNSPINAGRFYSVKSFDVSPGQVVSDTENYVPFDPHAYRGNRTAHVRVAGADGLPAAGKQLKVSWSDGHYGTLTVFEGPIPEDGEVTLENISDAISGEIPFGPFSASVDDETLGFFRLTEAGVQEFEFHLTPKEGDVAPDVELVEIETGGRLKLSDLRGQFVFLEFWETGCGPCQQPMSKLNALFGNVADAWKGKVSILPVGLDADPQVLAAHVKSRGWTNLRQYHSERSGGDYFADAARAFVILSVPTALLIDPDGRIVWRGHPSSFELKEEIAKRQGG